MNLEEIRDYCLTFKGVGESIKWDNHLCFEVGEKMFTILNLDGVPSISLKVTPEEYEELLGSEQFISAPYLGRYKWVYMADYNTISKTDLFKYIRQSYELIRMKLPKKVRDQLQD
ncbi:MAG: MmcQ/YjbR family DNA-binding protein [Bacteroidota bacterium]